MTEIRFGQLLNYLIYLAPEADTVNTNPQHNTKL